MNRASESIHLDSLGAEPDYSDLFRRPSKLWGQRTLLDEVKKELENILNNEDKLELLQKTKKVIIENIDIINEYIKDYKNVSLSALVIITIALAVALIINHGFSASLIPSLFTGLGFLSVIEGTSLYRIKHYKKRMTICEESLQEINEQEPKLEEEIENSKEKHNYMEEVNYLLEQEIEKAKNVNSQRKGLVRVRIKK